MEKGIASSQVQAGAGGSKEEQKPRGSEARAERGWATESSHLSTGGLGKLSPQPQQGGRCPRRGLQCLARLQTSLQLVSVWVREECLEKPAQQ